MVSTSSQYHLQLWALNVRSFEGCERESDRRPLQNERRRSEEIGQLTLKNSRRLCQTFPYFTASLSESEWRDVREWNRGGPKPNEMKGGVVGMPFTQSSTILTHSHTLLRPTKKSFKGSKDST